jgi:hypothetical protein
MSSNDLEKLQKFRENEREKRRDVTQTEEKGVWKPPRCCMQLDPSKYDAALQKQQAKACWKCCKNTNICYRNFCVNTENFQQGIIKRKIYF